MVENPSNWMLEAGAKVQNLLTKGSLNHLDPSIERKHQKQHFAEISTAIENAKAKDIETNVYLEDWSNGMRNSTGVRYPVFRLLEHARYKNACYYQIL